MKREEPAVSSPSVIAIAKKVMLELGISGKFNRDAVIGQIEFGLAHGRTLDQMLDGMIRSRRDYEANAAKLTRTVEPEKFFSSGNWRNPNLWSWKEGMRPQQRKTAPSIEEQNRR